MGMGLVGLALIGCNGGTVVVDPETATDTGTSFEETYSLADSVQGDPVLLSVQNLAFAPDGTLAIGDGTGEQLVAIALESGEMTDYRPDIEDLYQLIAEAFGDSAGTDANVWDIAAHPETGRIYVAAERISTGESALFRVLDDDTVEAVDLSDVEYSAVAYPATGTPGSLIMALEWTTDHLIAAVTEANWSTNQVVTVAVPVAHEDVTTVTSTNTYHRTHNQWETRAPVVSLAAYVEGGVDSVAATYTCTPAVRFTAQDLAAGAEETIGVTPFDYGGGKQVMDMVINTEGVYATIDGMLGRPDNPWEAFGVVRVSRSQLVQTNEVDEQAMQVVGAGENIIHPTASRVTSLDGSYRMALLDDAHIVVLQHAGLRVIKVTEP
jgi:hypothetical protein